MVTEGYGLGHRWRCARAVTSLCLVMLALVSVKEAAFAVQTVDQIAKPGPQLPASVRISLPEALSLFLKQNLDLLIAKYGIEYSKGQQITAKLFPNPLLQVGNMASFTQGNTATNSGAVGPPRQR